MGLVKKKDVNEFYSMKYQRFNVLVFLGIVVIIGSTISLVSFIYNMLLIALICTILVVLICIVTIKGFANEINTKIRIESQEIKFHTKNKIIASLMWQEVVNIEKEHNFLGPTYKLILIDEKSNDINQSLYRIDLYEELRTYLVENIDDDRMVGIFKSLDLKI